MKKFFSGNQLVLQFENEHEKNAYKNYLFDRTRESYGPKYGYEVWESVQPEFSQTDKYNNVTSDSSEYKNFKEYCDYKKWVGLNLN